MTSHCNFILHCSHHKVRSFSEPCKPISYMVAPIFFCIPQRDINKTTYTGAVPVPVGRRGIRIRIRIR